MGVANDLKTVEVKGPAGLIVINEKDMEMYRQKGYKLVSEVDVEDKKDEKEEKTETNSGKKSGGKNKE